MNKKHIILCQVNSKNNKKKKHINFKPTFDLLKFKILQENDFIFSINLKLSITQSTKGSFAL